MHPALSAPASGSSNSAPGVLTAERLRLIPFRLSTCTTIVTRTPHDRGVAAAAAPSRRSTSSSASSPHPPQAIRPLAAPHPSLILDAACAACCVALLATAAARHAAAVSSSSTQQQFQLQRNTAAAADPRLASAALGSSSGSLRHSSDRQLLMSPLPSTSGTAVATASSGFGAEVTAQRQWVLEAAPAAPLPAATAGGVGGGAPGFMGEAVAGCVLLVAASNAWFKLSGARRAASQERVASTEAAARLARLESLTDKQLAEFAIAVRQIDKLQVRTRLTSGDIRRPLAQLQTASADQSAVLVRLVGEQEALRGQLRDTQALLGALQGLTAKQFQVTVEAIKQLRAAQQAAASANSGQEADAVRLVK